MDGGEGEAEAGYCTEAASTARARLEKARRTARCSARV